MTEDMPFPSPACGRGALAIARAGEGFWNDDMTTLRADSLWQNFLILLGRLLIGWIFLESGWRKLIGMDAFIASLANRRVPYASLLGWIGAAVEFLGGLAIMLGFYTRCAALAIIVFTVIATAIGHRYWEIADAGLRRNQASHFSKNLAIIGGQILLLVTGGGRFSWDGWRRG
jgi:putative oxidoreductase